MSITDVLVVDDDIAVCRILRQWLAQKQYKVHTSESVAEAFATIDQKPFDVYMMDYKLPDGTGVDVAERIRSKGSEAPIILMSGCGQSAASFRAEKLRIFDFLEKPFSQEIICSVVKKAIGSPKAASELSQADSPVSAVASERTKSRFWRRWSQRATRLPDVSQKLRN
jgi:two-component system response regulator HydG